MYSLTVFYGYPIVNNLLSFEVPNGHTKGKRKGKKKPLLFGLTYNKSSGHR